MFLLNLDLNANETYVSTLVQLIEHFQKILKNTNY